MVNWKVLGGAAAAAVLTMASAANATVTWDYSSKVMATASDVNNGNGTWTYTFDVDNTDPSAIWWVVIYTGSQQAMNLSDTAGLDGTYTQYTGSGVWNLPGKPDQWFAGFFNYGWPGVANFAAGQSATFSFTTNADLGTSLDYAYSTQNNYGGEHFTAVGTSGVGGVPEPATWAMLILGIAGLGAALRRRNGALVVA